MMKTLVWIIVCAATAISVLQPVSDPDLWWHLVVGRWILANGSVPVVDHWNLLAAGQDWTAYSWLSEALYALIEASFGFLGLLGLKFLLFFLFVLSSAYVFSKLAADRVLGTVLAIIVVSACHNHALLRPQVVTWILAPLAILLGEKFSKVGFSVFWSIVVVGLFTLWANNHVSAVIGIAFLLAYSLKSKSFSLNAENLKTSFLVVTPAIIGTMLTPQLGGAWITAGKYSTEPLKFSTIGEFQPASFMQYHTNFMILLFAVAGVMLYARPKSSNIWRIGFVAALSLGSLHVVKFMPYGFIGVAAMIAELWGANKDEGSRDSKFVEGISLLLGKSAKIPALLIGLLAIVASIGPTYKLIKAPQDLQWTPVEEVDQLLSGEFPGPVLNIFGDGGYLIYRFSNKDGSPVHRVAVDGRSNVNDPELMSHYHVALAGRPGWQKVFDYLKPNSVLWKNKWPLVSILHQDPAWCAVSGNKDSADGWTLFVKRDWMKGHPEVFKACN